MNETWEIDWQHDGWIVELTRWLPNGGVIEVRLIYKRSTQFPELLAFCECMVTRRIGKFMDLPWPWSGVPSDPAEVIEMARRLADEYITPAPPATSGNRK